MKRKIACLMAAIMVLSTVFSVYAENGSSAGTQADTVTEAAGTTVTDPSLLGTEEIVSGTEGEVSGGNPGEGEVSGGNEAENLGQGDISGNNAGVPAAGKKAVGRVEVQITGTLFLNNEAGFTVTLSGMGISESREITVDNTVENADHKVCFTGLESGDYALSVKGDRFAEYTQQLRVENQGYLIHLMTSFAGDWVYKEEHQHPGVLLIGDVFGSGAIEYDDLTYLINQIEHGSSPADGTDFNSDLNGDGKIDLLDLDYFSRGYQLSADVDVLASVETFVSPEAVQAEASGGTKLVEGSSTLNDILVGEENAVVKLAPADGGEISAENPVEVAFDFAGLVPPAAEGGESKTEQPVMDGLVIGAKEVTAATLTVAYVDESGKDQEITVPYQERAQALTLNEIDNVINGVQSVTPTVRKDAHGNIVVNLGRQVAVKKVTFKITGSSNNNNLAEISKVEFVNGMEDRIPEPALGIPENLRYAAGSKMFTIEWDSCVNVTGYEVVITHKEGASSETHLVTNPYMEVTMFNGKELVNFDSYEVKVQSVNGSWRSGFCNPVTVVPEPTGKPDKPDNVTAAGKYQYISVSWKKMKDTNSYNLYYYKKEEGASAVKCIEGLTVNNYVLTLNELEEGVPYVIYVTGVNKHGESDPSLSCEAATSDLNPAKMPEYNLINRDENGKPGSSHIVSAVRGGGDMVDSSLDSADEKTAWGTVDNDPTTYYFKTTWDDGGYNNLGAAHGTTYTFDAAYKLDTIGILPTDGMNYFYAHIRWWDENDVQHDEWTRYGGPGAGVQERKDSEGRLYYWIKLDQPVTAKKIQIGLARYWHIGEEWNRLGIAEVYFYHYDTLKDEVMGLYEDDLHTVLRGDVTQTMIEDLEVKVNMPDQFGNENPNKDILLRELETAKKILNDEKLNDPVEIHNGITTNDVNRGFGGLNAWQPLGIVAAADEEITVYVGHNSKTSGDSTNLQLVMTQYHAESNAFVKTSQNLKVGANEIRVSKIWTTTGVESGGALYIQYTGNNAKDRYAVRVSGGVQIPILDLYGVTDHDERLGRTQEYITALQSYAAQIEEKHNELHSVSENSEVRYDYVKENCILEATDILLDTMMLSLPASQIISGSEGKAEKMLDSLDAMEEMMYLFYQHKGLNANAESAMDQIPKGHLNIRYQRMFSGAFMYASGNHIGIEWPETAGMMGAVPVVSDNGKYVSGQYFGWGIAHEIGHCINQGSYAVAEITNNYFAQLAQAQDKNEGMRFTYENIYKKVTSGAKGSSPNLATQLGMYWQLHLAYDSGYNYKTYEDPAEQLANLFYARMDTYARTPSKAPKASGDKGVALSIPKDGDQALMRLACAAAGKDILEFFERWGKMPDEDTVAYAAQFPKETRAIYYVNDDARVYRISGGTESILGTEGNVEAISSAVAEIDPNAANCVNLTFTPSIPEEQILGYEVVRCTISGGKVERQTVGFTTESTYTDVVATMNNRAVFYEITLVDKYLNRSAVKTVEALKIEHDGSLDKSIWEIITEGLTAEAKVQKPGEDTMSCTPVQENPAGYAIDGLVSTSYDAVLDTGTATIMLYFGETLTVSGFKYAGSEISYELELLTEEGWQKVTGTKVDDILYFANEDGAYVSAYAALGARLTIKGSDAVRIDELDLLGPTGDNVDWRRTSDDRTAVIGILAEDYVYANTEEGSMTIPKDSLIFMGSYKGNAAYNVVSLYDENGNIIGGLQGDALKAYQIILAEVPEKGNITDTRDGTWIYWIEPEDLGGVAWPKQVRAELYRVNNAQTNKEQRLVSDSLFEQMPAKEALPPITISSEVAGGTGNSR